MHSLPDIVKAIALNNKIDESRDFADDRAAVDGREAAHARTRRCKDLGVKQAPFVVLIGASMPSVLAEISFVTNKQEGKLLKTHGLPAADRAGAVRRGHRTTSVAEDASTRSRARRRRIRSANGYDLVTVSARQLRSNLASAVQRCHDRDHAIHRAVSLTCRPIN